ncbi:TKL family protein kinase [Histomonas meleagridis]|uniref:TKL family protein kinase n=1 Tax=Histomonas meleagridis TaxID=135588 RepID=UPI00355944CB|nr:TKL family protein kinase [Histomonas meleagridis]KAH0802940.1 TKL family protein kinase [Histomonas meleagridis]
MENTYSPTFLSTAMEFEQLLQELEQLASQAAVHRKKFEFAVSQFRKFFIEFSKKSGNTPMTPKQIRSLKVFWGYLRELQQLICQHQLHNWAHTTLENKSNTVATALTELATNLRTSSEAIDPDASVFFDNEPNQWLQYHLLDLKGISASFHQYIKNASPGNPVIQLMTERLESVDNFIKNYSSETIAPGVRVFSPIPVHYQSWRINFSDLTLLDEIGRGASANVFYGIDKRNQRRVAIKKLKYKKLTGSKLHAFQREVEVLASANHPCLLGFCGATDSAPFCIVTEWMPNGNLFQEIHKYKRFTPTMRTITAFDIARGMKYLHSLHIIHRDLKSLNILFDENFHAKICDFGFSRVSTENVVMTQNIGTPHWMAPEMLSGSRNYTSKVDVYAYGILLWEMAANALPYNGLDQSQIITFVLINNQRPTIPEGINPQLQKLITDCWDRDPSKRPTFDEIEKRFIQEKIVFNGTDVNEFTKYIESTIGLNPNSSSILETKLNSQNLTIEELYEAIQNDGIPNDLVNKCWDIIINNSQNTPPEIVAKATLPFLHTPMMSNAASLLRKLPCNSIDKSIISKEIEALPTGREDFDLDLVVTACKNGAAGLAAIYSIIPDHLKIALEIVANHGADVALRAAIGDRCVLCLKSDDSSLVCTALRCLMRLGQTKRITSSIMQRLLEKNVQSISNCVLVIATSAIVSNTFSEIQLEMIENVLKSVDNNEIASDFIVVACRMQNVAEFVLRKIESFEVKVPEICALKVVMTTARHKELQELVMSAIEKINFEKYRNEIESVKSLIEN